MKIKVFGSRGSIPTPLLDKEYRDKIADIIELYSHSDNKDISAFMNELPSHLAHIHGGNTSCVTIEDDSMQDEIIIVDAGSGLRVLGNELKGRNNLKIHIILSHFHWDHICGIPFFKPIYNPTNTVTFYSTCFDLMDNLARQQHFVHFPLPFDKLPATKKFVYLNPESVYELCGFNIRSVPLNHPGGSTAFVFNKDNKRISYITDTEFTPENIKEKSLYYKACFESSDVVLLDSQYSLVEFFSKFDWGHTATTVAANLALEWRIKRLVLFHFDPDHNDEDLIKLTEEAQNIIKTEYNMRKLIIEDATEGMVIDV